MYLLGEVSDEQRQRARNADTRDQPEPNDHRGLGPTKQFEVMMNG